MHWDLDEIPKMGPALQRRIEDIYEGMYERNPTQIYHYYPLADLSVHNIMSLDCSCCPEKVPEVDREGRVLGYTVVHNKFDLLDRFNKINSYQISESHYRN
jgi:hypothetical protein